TGVIEIVLSTGRSAPAAPWGASTLSWYSGALMKFLSASYIQLRTINGSSDFGKGVSPLVRTGAGELRTLGSAAPGARGAAGIAVRTSIPAPGGNGPLSCVTRNCSDSMAGGRGLSLSGLAGKPGSHLICSGLMLQFTSFIVPLAK